MRLKEFIWSFHQPLLEAYWDYDREKHNLEYHLMDLIIGITNEIQIHQEGLMVSSFSYRDAEKMIQ